MKKTKWYIEYPIVFIITFIIIHLFTPQRDETITMRITISLILSLIASIMAYSGYRSVKNKTTAKTNEIKTKQK